VTTSALVEDWKRHVLECKLCSNAKSMQEICPVGRKLCEPSSSASPAVAPAAVQVATLASSWQPDEKFLANIAHRVAQSVVARTNAGAAVAVPMEKTSALVDFHTSPDVHLRMPERDIEVYAAMRVMIRKMATLAEKLGKTVMVVEETKRHIRSASNEQHAPEEQVALVVRQVTGYFGTNEESLFFEFEETARQILVLGDKLGTFMRVDDDTRRVMQNARKVGIEMQGEMERAYDGKLPLDSDMRSIVRMLRMLAMDLQGEIERRIGTC